MLAAIRTHLLTLTPLTAIISTRLYVTPPQAVVLPAVRYTLIDDVLHHVLSGSGGWSRARVQFSCFSNSYSQTIAIAKEIRIGLDSFQGTLSGVWFGSILLDQERDMPPERLNEASPTYVYHRVQDYMVLYVTT